MTYFESDKLSQSDMKLILNSWKAYKNKSQWTATKSMLKGTGFHYLLLEPEKFEQEFVLNHLNLTTKEGRELKAANPTKTVLSSIDSDFLEQAEKAVREHPLSIIFDGDVEIEKELFWDNFRAKPDIINHSIEVVIDLKSIADVKKAVSAVTYDYALQARHYLDGVKEIYGKEYEFIFVFIETKFPYEVRFIQASPNTLSFGERMKQDALEIYNFYNENPNEYWGKFKELDVI